jgi:hypothetical protein
MNEAPLINTQLPQGVRTMNGWENHFNGFSRWTETVETVSVCSERLNTTPKRDVNETCALTI